MWLLKVCWLWFDEGSATVMEEARRVRRRRRCEERDVRREERGTRGLIRIERRARGCWEHREDGKDENIEIRNRQAIGRMRSADYPGKSSMIGMSTVSDLTLH